MKGLFLHRKIGQFAMTQIYGCDSFQPFSSCLEHGGGGVNGDYFPSPGGNHLTEHSSTASQITHHAIPWHHGCQGPSIQAAAVQIAPQPIPIFDGRGKKCLASRSSRKQSLCQAVVILAPLVAVDSLLPNQIPKSPLAWIEICQSHPVPVAGSVPTGADPIIVYQKLQMPTDGALGGLEDRAQFGDG
jgi:hypothetical protein